MGLHERDHDSILYTYRRLPVEIIRGQGVYLYDRDGNAYLDFLGGVAVNALGYGHAGLLAAIQGQASCYIHLSNYFVQKPQVDLAEYLTKASGFSRVFFCNSGTEAIEGSLKLARKWGNANGRGTFISMKNSFHGRTFGSLSAMSSDDYKSGFGPFLGGFVSVPLNDREALVNTVDSTTAAIIIEPIQGEGGIFEVTTEYAQLLMELKAKHRFLIIADEIQCGIGRTGTFLASEQFGLIPDIVTLAKPLGGGLPLGAILINEELKDILQPGNHGTTFGGNPVSCAAGLVVLREIVENGLMVHARIIGEYFHDQLLAMKRHMPDLIADVRGKGLMLGMELNVPGKPIVDALLERKLVVNCTHGSVLRFVPPLVVQREHIDILCNALAAILQNRTETVELSR